MGQRIETALMSVLLLGIIMLEALQIILRNFFSSAIFWADGVIRLGILWLTMLGAMAASREGRHLAIGLVERYFPLGWHAPAAAVAAFFAALVSGILSWHSSRFVYDSFRYGDTVLGNLWAWPTQLVMPIGFAVIAYRFLIQGVTGVRRKA